MWPFEWLGSQWRDTKRYFNLKDKSKEWPPAIVWLVGGLVLFLAILMVFF